ncbi:MFS transporter [Cellulomonas hominis]
MQHTFGRRASFWTAAAVAALALSTSAAPTLSYPLYATAWGLTPVVTTAVFAVYPIVMVAALLVFGDLSDSIGRRAILLIGLSLSALGVLGFALATDVTWLFVGRAFMGAGVALSLSPATAAMVDFSPAGQTHRASSVTTAATAVGLVLALLVSGGLIQYAPWPRHLSFWATLAAVLAVLTLTWFLPRHVPDRSVAPWRPRRPSVPRRIRGIYVTAALAVTAGYAIGAVLLSLGAQVAKQLIGTQNALVAAAVLAINATVIGTVAILARGVPARRSIVGGGTAAVLGLGTLVLSAEQHSFVLFLIASLLTGAAYSLLFLGGLTLINDHAAQSHRAGTLSAVYLVAYLLQGVTALALGIGATESGLLAALRVGAPLIAVLGVLAAVAARTIARAPAPELVGGAVSGAMQVAPVSDAAPTVPVLVPVAAGEPATAGGCR